MSAILGRLRLEPVATNLPYAVQLDGLTLGQVAAMRLELEGLERDMKLAEIEAEA